MTFLVSNPDNETDGGSLELDGASSVVSADVGGFTYVFVAGGVDDGISVFRLLANGTLTPVDDVTDTDDAALELDGARGLSTAMVDGNTYLFVAGQADNGVSVFRVGTNGSLTNVSNVTDDATMLLTGVSDTATARVGTSTYLYTAGTTENGISIFRVAGDGRLTYLSNQADAGALELAGVRALTTVTIGATSFLIAGGTDDGISVFSINASTGALTGTDDENDTVSINLQDVSDITTAVIGGVTYVFVAGAADNGVSVYSLSGAGLLTHIESESDSALSLIAGANSVSVTVLGGITYLHVGGTESGTSLYQFIPTETAGRILMHVDQIADSGSRELSGTTVTGTASVGGTTYLLGAGATDDGVSVFGTQTTGQVWYSTEGNLADARIAFVNTDGGNHVTFLDNNPATTLTTGFVEAVAIDSAAGLYYAIVTGNEGINARLIMGHIGSLTPPTVVFTFDPTYAGTENNLTFHIDINTFTETLYVGFINFNPFTDAGAGVRQFTYNTTTGAVSGGTFLVTETTAQTPPSTAGADGLFASQDMAFDTTHGVFYSQNLALGDTFETNTILRFSLANPGGAPGQILFPQAQFPLNGNGSDFTTLNGIIADIEVDEADNRLYFLTRAEDVEENTSEDSLWVVFNASTANGTVNATEVSLVGIVAADFYGEDMTLDEVNNILYIETENSNLVGGGTTDAIMVFQLNAAGTTATLINTINLSFGTTANLEGMHFSYIAALSGISGTATPAGEQGASLVLLTGAPTVSDFDGDHLASATVQITGGTFNSNENSFNDDDLGIGAGMSQSGTIAGTNIVISWNQATGTLTLTGYDTFANYQAALATVRYQSTGDNPTNYGLNPTRTITWTVSDGLPGIPGGQVNSATTQLTITAVNDGPTNTVPGAQVVNEDSVLNLAGLSIADPDLNPAITDIVVTLTATNGTVTLLTNVAGGLTAGDIANNGTGLVTITATRNEINATFAAVGGLAFLNTPDYNGAASVQIATNDGGNTGTGGALSDTDTINITVNAVVDIANDSPSFAEDSGGGAQTIDVLANDTFENAARFISSVTQGAHGVVTIVDGPDADGIMDYVVYTQVGDYNGSDSFTYTVTSGGVTEVATVNVTITAVADAVNDAPTFAEDSGAQTIDVLGNDSFENAARFISAVTQGAHGVVTIVDGPDADGIMDYVVYTQVADYNGSDSFTYTVTSGGVTEVATVNVTITAVADIADDSVTVAEDSGVDHLNGIGNISLLANDSFENAGRAITAVGAALHGTTAINNNGTAGDATDDYVTYTPTGDYNGPDSFTYTVTSGGVTETATVTVNVTAVNDDPINTKPGTQTINEDATLTFSTGGGNAISVSDIDAAPGTLTVTLAVVNGQLTLSGTTGLAFGAGDGTDDTMMTFTGTATDINAALQGLLYETTLDYNGVDTLTITTNDNGNTGTPGALQDMDTVTINITAVADIANDTVPLAEDAGATQLDLLANDSFENPGRSITSVTQGLHGFVAINDNNTVGDTSDDYVVYTAAADYNGADSFTYTVTSGGVTETATVNVTISAVVDIADDAATVGEDGGATTIDVIANDSFENAGFSITAVTQGLHGTVAIIDGPDADLNPDYVTYTPTADYNGSDSFTYTVTSGGVTETATVNVTISAVADIVDDSVSVLADSGANNLNGIGNPVSLLANDNFESAGRFISAVTQGVNGGTVAINNNGTAGDPTDDYVVYTPAGGYTGPDSFTYTVTSGGVTETANVTVSVGVANAPPAVDLNGAGGGIDNTASYTENAAPTLLSPTDLAVTDADDTNIESATVKITGGFISNFDYLTVNGGTVGTITGINFSYSAASGILTLTGSATLADYQAVLRQVGFESTSDVPGASRTITWTVNDGMNDSAIATTTVNITALDDAPVAQPDAYTITESGTIAGGNLFADNGSGADSDPDGPPLAISAVGGGPGANVGTEFALDSGALLTVRADGTFDYNPGSIFLPTPTAGSGASNTPSHDSFTYTLAGGNTVTVNLTLTGLDTDDLLLGTSGADTMDGGIGNDTLRGGAGVDILFGGDGNDVISGGTGTDGMYGGTGNDVFYVDEASDYLVEASGEGTDLVYASVSFGLIAGVEVEILSTTQNSGTGAIDLYGNEFDNVIYGNAGANLLSGDGGNDVLVGLGGDDLLSGDDGNDTLDGGAGNNTLLGGAGVDILLGGDNNDVLDGGTGADGLYGGDGNDSYYVDQASDFVVEAANRGTDLVYASASYALAAGSHVEILSTTQNAGTGAIDLTGNELDNIIYGNAGINLLIGGAGNDVLVGLGDDDRLIGDNGTDTLDGGSGNDTLLGGALADTLLGGDGDDVIDGGTGADSASGGDGNDVYFVDDALDAALETSGQGSDVVYAGVSYTLTGGSHVENLSTVSMAATTAIDLTGNELANVIYGNAGANVLNGGDGNDALVGAGGADTFAFTTALGAGNVDQIADFVSGTDKIALDDAVFTGLGLGSLPANAFVTGTAAADADDRIIYDSANGNLYYDADGNGAGAAVLFANLQGHPTLIASDFQVI